ncbi:MAG: choice-of-anchor C family protein [Casimicrobiaceae bacterium]
MNRILGALPALVLCSVVQAAPFQNGSFESGSVPNTCNVYDLPIGSTTITGWTVIQGAIDWEGPSPCGWVASNGSNSIDLLGQGGSTGGIQQTFDTIPGSTYSVSFDLAGNYGGAPVVKPLTVTVASVTQSYTFDTTGKSATNMGWTRKSFTFTATSSSSTLAFVSNVGFVSNAGAVIDNVTVAPLGTASTAVPLDWAQWAAAILLLTTGVLVLRRDHRAA